MRLLLFKTMKDCVVTIGSAIWEWGIPEKNQIGGVEDILFWKNPGIFRFSLYPWKFQTIQSFTPRNSTQLCITPSEILRTKTKTPGNTTPRNSMSVLTNPWKFHLLFLQEAYPQEIPYTQLPVCLFFWNCPIDQPFCCPPRNWSSCINFLTLPFMFEK